MNFFEIFQLKKLLADIVFFPPPFEFYFEIILFLGLNFIINFIVFSIGAHLFAKKEIKFPPSALCIFFLTIAGFLMDFLGIIIGTQLFSGIIFTFSLDLNELYGFFLGFFLVAILISGLDFLIINRYLKLDKGRSLKLAIWMGIITNPVWLFLIFLV